MSPLGDRTAVGRGNDGGELVRRESHHPTETAESGGSIPARPASAAPPGPRIRTGGAGGHHGSGALPGSLLRAARGRHPRLRIVRRGAPASTSRPSRLPSHSTVPVGKAG